MLTGIVILLFVFVYLFNYKPVLKEGKKTEKIVHISIMSISFIVLILYSFGISVPSPTEPIKNVVSLLFGVS